MHLLDGNRQEETLRPLGFAERNVMVRMRAASWGVMVFAGLIETVISRHSMQDDGICYLDMGDAIMRHDWKMALNGVWSPLYPFLQALTLHLFKPSSYSQFTFVHAVNFFIYLFAFACFEFFLYSLTSRRPSIPESVEFPKAAIYAIGYSVFLWASLSLVTLQLVVPDILMAAFVYLAMGLLLQIWAGPHNLVRFAALGAVLGFAYLAKAPMFPLSLAFFFIAWMFAGTWKQATPRVAIAVLAFAVIAGPWVAALSHAKGHLTFGESARFNYIVHVNGAGPGWYFQDLGSARGRLVHPVHKVFDMPPVYEFASRRTGTSPIEYDPSYWSEGAVPRVSLRRQLEVLHHYAGYYLDQFFMSQTTLFAGFIVVCFFMGHSLFWRQVSNRWPVWLIGLLGLAMYSFVHVELRYVGVFFTLLWLGLLAGSRVPAGRQGRQLALWVTVAIVVAMAGPTLMTVAGDTDRILRDKQPHKQWQAAQDLQRMGVSSGDLVARLPAHYGLAWARLLGVSEAAEIPLESAVDFWCASPERQARVIDKFRQIGATVFVAEQGPPSPACPAGAGWRKIGDGTYYALKLRDATQR